MWLSHEVTPVSERLDAGYRHALRRNGVLPRHIRTIALELDDHHSELLEELTRQGYQPAEAAEEAHRRLGSTEVLVRLLSARQELKSDRYRRPWLFFAVGPACVWLISYVIAVAAVVGLLDMSSAWPDDRGAILLHSASVVSLATMWCVPLVIAAMCCVTAAKWQVHSRWPIVGSILTVVLSGMMQLAVGGAPDQVALTLGIGIGINPALWAAVVGKLATAFVLVVVPYRLWRTSQSGKSFLGG